MAMQATEKTKSLVTDLSNLAEGDFIMLDVGEYSAVKHLLHQARIKNGKVTIPLWDRKYCIRKIPAMGFTFVGRPEE